MIIYKILEKINYFLRLKVNFFIYKKCDIKKILGLNRLIYTFFNEVKYKKTVFSIIGFELFYLKEILPFFFIIITIVLKVRYVENR